MIIFNFKMANFTVWVHVDHFKQRHVGQRAVVFSNKALKLSANWYKLASKVENLAAKGVLRE